MWRGAWRGDRGQVASVSPAGSSGFSRTDKASVVAMCSGGQQGGGSLPGGGGLAEGSCRTMLCGWGGSSRTLQLLMGPRGCGQSWSAQSSPSTALGRDRLGRIISFLICLLSHSNNCPNEGQQVLKTPWRLSGGGLWRAGRPVPTPRAFADCCLVGRCPRAAAPLILLDELELGFLRKAF